VGSPRVGEVTSTEVTSTKEKPTKPPESDLRRRICLDGSCKDPKPEPTDGDLRHRICTNGKCGACPPGESPGKNGACVAAPADLRTATTCQPNESWNGSACTPMNRCQAGETWNGFECVRPGQCAIFSSRGSLLAMDARGFHRDMDLACSKDPNGQECIRLKQSYDASLLSFQMLLNEAPVSCRTMLPDPISL
jgi:hypothetical protein